MKKLLMSLALVLLGTALLTACGGKKKISIWVGVESVKFYEQEVAKYKEAYKEKEGKDLGYQIAVLGIDTGTAADSFLGDPEAGADIFTVAHDNLGKLIAGSSAIAPIKSEKLLAQVNQDNPDAFLSVIKGTVGGNEYTFGIPYIAQALVLYYDKSLITDEQVKTWEGIQAAAKAHSETTKAVVVTGDDGFNNSFLLLASNKEKGTTLKLYPNGVAEDSYATGDDTVSIMKWGQRFFTDPNGGLFPTSDGWEVTLKNGKALAVISGAWHYSGASSALGSKLGIATLPAFTITAADAYGTVEAGTVYHSGTFADTKMFVMKKGMKAEKQEVVEDLLLYLSSKEVQERSYKEANNLPAYKNAAEEFESMKEDTTEALLARTQIEMFAQGIAQPFGAQARFNTWYYSKNGPVLIKAILENEKGQYETFEQIKAQLEKVQKIWRTGSQD